MGKRPVALLILQDERALSAYPIRDPGTLEGDIHRPRRDITQLRAQISAKWLVLLEEGP